MRPRALLTAPAVPAVALAALAAGCGGLPPTVGPTGVDGLPVPLASPDPAAYVEGVDHPHLPLGAGERWTLADPVRGTTLVVEVAEEPRTVAGVTTTGLRLGARATAWLAEDEAGHVWLLAGEGPQGAWESGVDGVAAGLALAAEPRTGDGHPLWSVDGVPAAGATVLGTDGDLAVPWGITEDVVTLALDTDPSRPGPEQQVVLGTGVGPVAVEDLTTGADLVLVARS